MEDVTSELPIQIDGKKYPKISLVVYPHITRSKNLEGSVFWLRNNP